MGSGSKSKEQLKKEPHAKLAAQKQTDLERQRKAEEKQATADERVQSLVPRKAENTSAWHAKKAKVATLDVVAKVGVAQIKADASKVFQRLARPRAYIKTITEHGKWESVPRSLQITVQTIMTELSAMYDEAEGKLSDPDPIPFSFDMASVGKVVQRVSYIRRWMWRFL